MPGLHETEKNFVRFAIVALNKANILGLNDAAVAGMTNPATATVLNTTINDLNVHETFKNFTQRQLQRILNKVNSNGLNVLTDAEIDTARGTGTFVALRGELTEEDTTIFAGLDFGEQATD